MLLHRLLRPDLLRRLSLATELATKVLATRVFVETALETSDLETVLSMDTKLDTGALDTATPGPSGSKLVLACALAPMICSGRPITDSVRTGLRTSSLRTAFLRATDPVVTSLVTAHLVIVDSLRTTLRTASLRT